ncbi:hypothetical protein D3C80_1930540 [compost metagenome]
MAMNRACQPEIIAEAAPEGIRGAADRAPHLYYIEAPAANLERISSRSLSGAATRP